MVGESISGNDFKLFSGSSNRKLAEAVAEQLGVKLGALEISAFSDSETIVRLKEDVKDVKCAVMQSLSAPQDHNLMELLIIANALKNNGAKSITAVIPYLAYARQDVFYKGEPLTAGLVADLIKAAGIDSVIAIDIHSAAARDFFKIPLKNLSANKILVEQIAGMNLEDLVVVAPDKGAIGKGEENAKLLGVSLARVEKFRPAPNVAEIKLVDGNVNAKNAVIFDDMIDTAGTIVKNAEALKKMGTAGIYVCATHAILSGNALEKLENAPVEEILLTDTIALPEGKMISKIKTISVAGLLAQAVREEI